MNRMFWVRAIALSCLSSSFSQQPTPMAPDASGVPRLVSFEGMLRDPSGKPHAGIAGITFAIYKDQHEGAPLLARNPECAGGREGQPHGSTGRDQSRRCFTFNMVRLLRCGTSLEAVLRNFETYFEDI